MAIPALPDTERLTEYTVAVADDGPFSVGFHIYADDDDPANWVEVWLDGEQQDGNWTLTSAGGGADLSIIARPITDARITFDDPITGDLVIVGARRPRQASQFRNGQSVSADQHNRRYTDIMAICREFWDLKERMFLVAPGSAGGIITEDDLGDIALIATQAEAEAGTNNTHLMTPLRTTQAVAAYFAVVTPRQFGAVLDGSTDDTTAMIAAADYCRANDTALFLPGGKQMRIDAGNIDLTGIRFFGTGTYDSEGLTYGQFGSVVRLTGTTNSPFLLGFGSKVDGLTFFWPNQTETGSAPTTYPPLLKSNTGYAVDIEIVDNLVINAFDFVLLGNGDVAGRNKIMRNRGFVLRRAIDLRQCTDIQEVKDNNFSPGFYQDVVNVGPTFALRDYAADNGKFIHIDTGTYPSVDGLIAQGNFIFGMRYGVHVAAGTLAVSTITNNQFDGVAQPFFVDGSADLESVTFSNNHIYAYRNGDRAEADTAISVLSSGSSGEFVCKGNTIYNSDGSAIIVAGTIARLDISGNLIQNWGSTTGADVERLGIHVDCSGGEGLIANNKTSVDLGVAPSALAISLVAGTLLVSGNQMAGGGARITGGTVTLAGNKGPTAPQVTGGTVTYLDNDWSNGENPETEVTSAATCDIGATPSRLVVVSGSTGPITSFGTKAYKWRRVRFSSTPTITHNATSLILPGGANINAVANDVMDFVSDSSGNWRLVGWHRAANAPMTLVGTDTTQTLTNKTLTSPVLTTPQINDTSADHQYVFAVSELAADRTVTLPLLGGNDTFVFADFSQTLTNKTVALGSNTVSGTKAQFNTAVTDDNFAYVGTANTFTQVQTTSVTGAFLGTWATTNAGGGAIIYRIIPATGAANDALDWQLAFKDDAGNEYAGCVVRYVQDTATNGAESVSWLLQTVQSGGALTQRFKVGAGVQVGSPTGGDKGAGTINVAGDIYKNDTAYTNPDYVFEHEYTGQIARFTATAGDYRGRLPLSELRAYTREHLRLPGISDEPMGMFERGDKALEKIEELTLYILDLHEEIQKLKAS